jgi:hypothetical protein
VYRDTRPLPPSRTPAPGSFWSRMRLGVVAASAAGRSGRECASAALIATLDRSVEWLFLKRNTVYREPETSLELGCTTLPLPKGSELASNPLGAGTLSKKDHSTRASGLPQALREFRSDYDMASSLLDRPQC